MPWLLVVLACVVVAILVGLPNGTLIAGLGGSSFIINRASRRACEDTRVPLLTELLGREVVDATGVGQGRLVDIAVDLRRAEPEVVRALLRRGRRGPVREVPWAEVADLGPPARLGSGCEPRAASPQGRAELLLAAHVLDRQIFDAQGMHLRRVGDVELSAESGRLRVTAVEVGLATLMRRVGLGRLGRGIEAEVVDWPELHVASGPGHGLQLAATAAGVHRLGVEQLAALTARLPAERADEVLGAAEPARAHAARALATGFRRRPGPLHLRRRAPA